MVFGRQAVDSRYQKELAKQLYKYQDFKGTCITDKVTSEAYQASSIIAFHSLLRKYLATGQKDLKRATEEFYTTIDNLKDVHYSILRPSEREQARPYTEHKRIDAPIKTSKIEVKPQSPKKLDLNPETLQKINQRSNSIVALRHEGNFKIFKNEDEMNGYMMAYKEIDETMTFEKVRLTVESM